MVQIRGRHRQGSTAFSRCRPAYQIQGGGLLHELDCAPRHACMHNAVCGRHALPLVPMSSPRPVTVIHKTTMERVRDVYRRITKSARLAIYVRLNVVSDSLVAGCGPPPLTPQSGEADIIPSGSPGSPIQGAAATSAHIQASGKAKPRSRRHGASVLVGRARSSPCQGLSDGSLVWTVDPSSA